MAAIALDGCLLEYASDELQADREVVLAAIHQSGITLEFAYEAFRLDDEIVYEASLNNPQAFRFVSRKQVKDRDLVLRIAKGNGDGWDLFVEQGYQNDREVVLAAVRCDGKNLQYASMELQNDKQIVIVAVLSSPDTLMMWVSTSEELKNDPDVLAAIEEGWARYQNQNI